MRRDGAGDDGRDGPAPAGLKCRRFRARRDADGNPRIATAGATGCLLDSGQGVMTGMAGPAIFRLIRRHIRRDRMRSHAVRGQFGADRARLPEGEQ